LRESQKNDYPGYYAGSTGLGDAGEELNEQRGDSLGKPSETKMGFFSASIQSRGDDGCRTPKCLKVARYMEVWGDEEANPRPQMGERIAPEELGIGGGIS